MSTELKVAVLGSAGEGVLAERDAARLAFLMLLLRDMAQAAGLSAEHVRWPGRYLRLERLVPVQQPPRDITMGTSRAATFLCLKLINAHHLDRHPPGWPAWL